MLQENDLFGFLELNEITLALFEFYFVFFVILAFSVLVSHVLLRMDYGGFSTIIFYLLYVGVLIHELSHLIACVCVGIKPAGLVVKYRNKKNARSYSKVRVSEKSLDKMTLLQSIIICFAPLFVSTWMIYFSLTILFISSVNPFLRVFAGFLCVSCFLGACPSDADFRFIPAAFGKDPLHSFYQIFLLLISFLASLFWLNLHGVLFENFFFYYIIVIVFYVIFKYGFILVKISVLRLKHYKKKSVVQRKINFKPFTRRTSKPLDPKNIGIKESPW